MKLLITGSSGFIGHALVKKMAGQGDSIVGLDNINSYYDVNLKYGRLEDSGIERHEIRDNKLVPSNTIPDYRFVKMNLEDGDAITRLFEEEKFDRVCHLAAQAGVRYSLENPRSYIDSNVVGFLNILEACRHNGIDHLVYASSSSVYGLNTKMPFSTHDMVDQPVSLYAASKKSGELMAHTYSHLFAIPTTGLRFFTVYGPWGRPDMAVFKFVKSILEGQPIDVYNHGKMSRDFTYIDDIIEGVVRVLNQPPAPSPQPLSTSHESPSTKDQPPAPSHQPLSTSHQSPATKDQPRIPYKIYNIGRGRPVNLMDFIFAIEKALGKVAQKTFLPLQPGDVVKTWADTEELERDTGYRPSTTVEEGIRKFVEWYKGFYKLK